MKLSDFNKKPIRNRATPTQFVLQNDTAIQQYKEQIADLDKQLGFYRTIEAERDSALKQLTVKEEALVTVQKSADELREELEVVKKTVGFQEEQLQQIPQLEEDVRAAKGQYGQVNNELQNITTASFEQSKTISLLGMRVEALTSDNTKLESTTRQAMADKISAEAEFQTVNKENKELKNSTEYTSKINRELREAMNKMTDKANFWEKEAHETSIQIKEALVVEEKLRQWLTDLEQKESATSTAKGNLNNEIVALKKTLKDMGIVIEDLMKEMT